MAEWHGVSARLTRRAQVDSYSLLYPSYARETHAKTNVGGAAALQNQQGAYPNTHLAWPKSRPAHGSFIRCRQLPARLVSAVPRLEWGSTNAP